MTLTEFAWLFLDAGATVAYNLDGGGSATMFFNDRVVNQPRNIRGQQKERPAANWCTSPGDPPVSAV